MDKETLKLLKAELKDDMKQRGFKTEGQWYMRLVNSQIYQTVYFQGSSGGNEFCINIGLVPLCRGNTDNKTYLCQERLGVLARGRDKWWDYTAASAKDAVDVMRKTALPIFDACSSYRGLFEYVKPIWDGSKNDSVKRILWCFGSDEWVKILLSLGETEYCKLVLNNYISAYAQDIQRYGNNPADPADKYNLARDIDNINREKSRLALVESGDLAEILKEIEQNEAASLAALAKYIVKA